MESLTGGDAGMIRWVDRWLLILVKRYYKKISGRGFQKARFWTLDDDSRAEKFSGGGATLSRFLHRRVAGNMRPLTGGDAGMIRWGDRWLLILVRRYFKKFPAVVSKKLEFGHLRVKGENDDDDPRAEKFSGGGVILPDFSHVGVRGVWLNA